MTPLHVSFKCIKYTHYYTLKALFTLSISEYQYYVYLDYKESKPLAAKFYIKVIRHYSFLDISL